MQLILAETKTQPTILSPSRLLMQNYWDRFKIHQFLISVYYYLMYSIEFKIAVRRLNAVIDKILSINFYFDIYQIIKL